jgi:hypothetical protein
VQEADPDTTATIVSVAIGAGAVIIAAVIAAITAHWRLKRTLSWERDRLRDELSSDRRLRDVESLRDVFDGSLQAATQYRLHLADYEDTWDLKAYERQSEPAILEALGAKDRLEIRLGRDEEVMRAYSDLLGSFSSIRNAIALMEHAERSAPWPGDDQAERWAKQREEARGRLQAAKKDGDNSREVFVRAARALVAAELEARRTAE